MGGRDLSFHWWSDTARQLVGGLATTETGETRTRSRYTRRFMTRRFRFREKISDALFGQVLRLEIANLEDADAVIGVAPVLAVKCISMGRAREIAKLADRLVDNPAQEQRVAALLAATGGHPNVVQFYDHVIEEDTIFLVMEYCAGGDLHSHIRESSVDCCLEEPEALTIMAQVLRGVHFLHSHGIAHRDLSLENVLLCHQGTCKIADFGLSTDASKPSRDYVGKEFYMAPEVVARDSYDPTKADVWSIGIMWFMMLTGSPLLSIASPSEKGYMALANHGVGAVFTAWGLRGRISDETIHLIGQMLQIDPSKRISLAAVLAHPVVSSS